MKIVIWEETIEEGAKELPPNAKVLSKEKGKLKIQIELRLVTENVEELIKKYYPNAIGRYTITDIEEV
jgi:hypothetical protein